MLDKVLVEDSWSCLCDVEQHPGVVSALTKISNIPSLISQLQSLPHTLKDNHRSLVKRGPLALLDFQSDVVAKRPVDKHKRKFSRFSSRFVAGEASATVENLARLKQAGIESVSPLFSLEKRLKGQIVDSWICYEYRQGSPCDERDLDDIVSFLRNMHEAGFRHGDPTWNNFLRDQNGVLFTIDTKAKPCRGAFHATHDFLLLQRANGLANLKVSSLMSSNRASIGYWLARLYFGFKTVRSTIRDKIKKNRPKNT